MDDRAAADSDSDADGRANEYGDPDVDDHTDKDGDPVSDDRTNEDGNPDTDDRADKHGCTVPDGCCEGDRASCSAHIHRHITHHIRERTRSACACPWAERQRYRHLPLVPYRSLAPRRQL